MSLRFAGLNDLDEKQMKVLEDQVKDLSKRLEKERNEKEKAQRLVSSRRISQNIPEYP